MAAQFAETPALPVAGAICTVRALRGRCVTSDKQLFDLAASFRGNGDQIRVIKSLATLSDYVKVHFRDQFLKQKSRAGQKKQKL